MSRKPPLYSIIIALEEQHDSSERDYREGDICIDWVDYHSEKDVGNQELGSGGLVSRAKPSPVPAHQAVTSSPLSPNASDHSEKVRKPLSRSATSESGLGVPYPVQRQTQGTTELGPGVIHLFKHAQPLSLLESLEADLSKPKDDKTKGDERPEGNAQTSTPTANVDAEGQDGTLIAILAVPIWMDVANLANWLGAFTVCLEGYRMIR
jgi:BRCA1-associated protein